MIRFVASTRLQTMSEFLSDTLLGQSLQRVALASLIEVKVGLAAKDGLAEVYNPEIEQAHPDDILVFVHDDVQIDDWLIALRLTEALSIYDVVGVAGNVERIEQQRGWRIILEKQDDTHYQLKDTGILKITVADSNGIDVQNPVHGEVKLLDGLFLATKAGSLQKSGVRFDPKFRYHYYDLDFCRQCESAGLKMGFWPMAITHGSTIGKLDQEWLDLGTAYLAKWGG